jgi:tripartite-type tricarboxylate transporter receptor subunit TctC
MNRRHLLSLCAAAAWLSRAPGAMAQTYPARPIHVIVAYPPGGQSDLITRLVAKKLGSLLGVPMVVENRPGAGGTVGVEVAARAPADGYTLLLSGGSALTLSPAVDSSVRFDAQRDFIPVARVARVPLMLIASAALPITSMPELIAHARKHPGKLTYASSSTMAQVAIEALKISAGLDMLRVPYAGSAPAILDLAAGRIDIGLMDVAVVAPHVHSGRAKLLACAGTARARTYPEVPTAAEQGFPEFVWEPWSALFAPTGTPAAAVSALQSAMRQALAAPDFREGLANLGFDPIDEDAQTFPALLGDETARYRRLVSRIGLRIDK